MNDFRQQFPGTTLPFLKRELTVCYDGINARRKWLWLVFVAHSIDRRVQGEVLMKQLIVLVVVVALFVAPLTVQARGPGKKCPRITDGVLTYPPGYYLAGTPFSPGYDMFGYNYQAHIFNGYYVNVYLNRDGYPPFAGDAGAYLAANPGASGEWYWPYHNIQLVMKWNDAWISNQDCDDDGVLDRHYGFPTYVGSGAWETTHMHGTFDGCEFDSMTKIIAVPADATLVGDLWYAAGGAEIGYNIWGGNEFAMIQDISNDACYGERYVSPVRAGLGGW